MSSRVKSDTTPGRSQLPPKVSSRGVVRESGAPIGYYIKPRAISGHEAIVDTASSELGRTKIIQSDEPAAVLLLRRICHVENLRVTCTQVLTSNLCSHVLLATPGTEPVIAFIPERSEWSECGG